MSESFAITLQSVSRFEKGAQDAILKSVSADLREGRLIALVGADGSGKTTLMRVMAGLLKPQKGTVRIFGEELYSEHLSQLQSFCGYMPQQFGLYTDLSVEENLTLYADLFGLSDLDRKERFAELLSMTGLTDFTARPAGKLSGGMKQKLGLACALLNRPKILLLDEPSVGVDPLSRRELWAILKKNVQSGAMTVVVATTYMDEASLCDDVLIVENGEVVLHNTPEAIASLAEGLSFNVNIAKGRRVRDVQAQLLDDTDLVLDAVPRAGSVRVLIKNQSDRALLEQRHHICLQPTASGLEEGYLVNRAKASPIHSYKKIGDDFSSSISSTEEKPIVVAKDLVRRFGSFTAVDRTSFEVKSGEIFGLLGPNGAGKTTTFKMLCGLLKVTEGELEVAGVNVRHSSDQAREQLGYMSQKFALYADLSVSENFDFFASAYGLSGNEKEERIDFLIKEFDLQSFQNTQAKNLPGGIKQRLAMAVALIHKPKLLFLDEPTSGADVLTRRQFWRWITALSHMGTSIIVTTHFMEEALYCDRLLIQDAGLPLIMGSPEEVRGQCTTMDEAFIQIVKAFREKRRRL